MEKSKNKKARGRPRTFERDKAVEVAMHLFWEKGYEETSISDLTGALGITPPSLYAAFGSKEKLYLEAVELYLATRSQHMLEPLSTEKTPGAGVEGMLRRAVELFTDGDHARGCLVANGLLRYSSENESVAKQISALRQRGLEAIRACIDRGKENQELSQEVDSVAIASFYAALVQGLSVQAIDGASKTMLDAIVDFAMAAWPSRA